MLSKTKIRKEGRLIGLSSSILLFGTRLARFLSLCHVGRFDGERFAGFLLTPNSCIKKKKLKKSPFKRKGCTRVTSGSAKKKTTKLQKHFFSGLFTPKTHGDCADDERPPLPNFKSGAW